MDTRFLTGPEEDAPVPENGIAEADAAPYGII